MATPASKPKQSFRWGSLISNLESKLDNLFEEDANRAVRPPQVSTVSTTTRSRSASRTRSVRADTPVSVIKEDEGSARPSLDIKDVSVALDQRTDKEEVDSVSKDIPQDAIIAEDKSLDIEDSTRMQYDQAPAASSTASHLNGVPSTVQVTAASVEDLEDQVAELQAAQSNAALQHGEEVQGYLERIDALETKLQYLAKESAEAARKEAETADAGSLQKKLAAKDEQIALLMEEGQKLSKAEVTQSGNARKLRFKAAEDERTISELRRKVGFAERSAADIVEKLRRAEASQKELLAKAGRIPQLEREVQTIKAARDELQATTQVLRRQLDDELSAGREAKARATTAALDEQQRLNKSLQEDNAKLHAELQEARDAHRAEVRAAADELEREQDRKKTLDAQLRNEINILENRLETVRARTEEASSGTTNDTKAKLMRQIETMQSQYAVARENWQGIESTLHARLTALEKERDDASKAESDVRKRSRESATNLRKAQDQLEESSRRCFVLEQEMSEHRVQADKLAARAREFERNLLDAKKKFEQEKVLSEANFAARLEDEKTKWRHEAFPNSIPIPEPSIQGESPPVSGRRYPPELSMNRTRPSASRQYSSAEMSSSIREERGMQRRSSSRLWRTPSALDIVSPNGYGSGRSTPMLNGLPETPSLHAADDDDFDNESSPQRTVNDVISGSTAGAGPSVQLVERMSAAVRRLESEKAATKDELSRLTAQRDEARKEVVSMTVEIEAKHSLEKSIQSLKKDLGSVEERYQTTLEMLGEKTERVEELEADVADLKKIYRELVQTMK